MMTMSRVQNRFFELLVIVTCSAPELAVSDNCLVIHLIDNVRVTTASYEWTVMVLSTLMAKVAIHKRGIVMM